MGKALLFLIISIGFCTAHAEYRVFTLHIIDSTQQSTRQVETTLDPEQFISIYPLKNSETISYIETWRCRGRTDFFKEHCPNPRLNSAFATPVTGAPDRGPASTTSQSPEVQK